MTLNPETLERILFDKSLGELPPDVEALLKAYLQDQPQAVHLAEETERTVNMARSALYSGPQTTPTDLPPPSFLRAGALADRPKRKPHRWLRLIPAAAAMIVLAFWLGTQYSAAPVAQQPTHQIADARPKPRITTTTSGGFWSVARLHRSISQSNAKNHATIRWPGPLRRPRIGEKS